MQKQNQPSNDSTTPTDQKSPPSSPQHPPPPPPPPPPSDDDTNKGDLTIQNSGGEIKMKTPLEVLAELASSESPESNEGGDGGSGGMSLSGGTSLALAVHGGPTVVVQEAGGEGRGKKRKGSDVKDPPSGKPSCPLCFKEFMSWKGAFGHMRKHPDREYRGFYKPPVSTPSLARDQSQLGGDHGDAGENSKGEGKSTGEGRSSSPIRGVAFDLNLQPIDGAGSSNAAEINEAPVSPPADQENIVDEGKKGFDLNEMPTDEE